MVHIIEPMPCKLFILDFLQIGYMFQECYKEYENLSQIGELEIDSKCHLNELIQYS